MSIDKLAVKSGAGVVLLRERKKQFARAYRTRVDGIISNLFVKYLGADASSHSRPSNLLPRQPSRDYGLFLLHRFLHAKACRQPVRARHSTSLESEL
jgi:hypothetical protein